MAVQSSQRSVKAADAAAVKAVDRAARALVSGATGPLGLAVSGGSDSMVMMDAVQRALARAGSSVRDRVRVVVLTFDHGTGPHSEAAASLVSSEAKRRRFEARVGRAALAGATEAEWRAARWSFLRTACSPGATIATAHTRDDQLETVVMRAMRDAGARGLAGLAPARAGVARPFLELSRDALRRYARVRHVTFVDDPTNRSRDYLRNRIRHDLLPAILALRPRFGDAMLDLAERASALRSVVDTFTERFALEEAPAGGFRVARHELATYDSAALCVLWPAIAARAHVTLDRRGTQRLAQFTTHGAPGARIQVSGGIEVVRDRESFVFRRLPTAHTDRAEVPLDGVVEFGGWRFLPVGSDEPRRGDPSTVETLEEGFRVDERGCWTCDLPVRTRLSVRSWRAGDRMRSREGGPARRVKRFLGDAHVPGPSRGGWPVVLADDEIVWIPGVGRTVAAPERSGRPVIRYTCERFDGGYPYN